MDYNKLTHIIKVKSLSEVDEFLKKELGVTVDECHIVQVQIGICKVCKQEEDLRLGVCFKCSDKVSGVDIGKGYHFLYETKKPDNDWIIRMAN